MAETGQMGFALVARVNVFAVNESLIFFWHSSSNFLSKNHYISALIQFFIKITFMSQNESEWLEIGKTHDWASNMSIPPNMAKN